MAPPSYRTIYPGELKPADWHQFIVGAIRPAGFTYYAIPQVLIGETNRFFIDTPPAKAWGSKRKLTPTPPLAGPVPSHSLPELVLEWEEVFAE